MKDTLEDAAERLARGQGGVEDAERVASNRPRPEPKSTRWPKYQGKLEPFTDLGDE